MKTINIKLEAFEGPFDLLYHLIEKNKIDIYNIPISSLTDQYIEFIENSNSKDMDNMSEFIVMATTLLEIKSKMLLPKIKDENNQNDKDPREELVKKLIEYKKFKNIADDFRKREKSSSFIYFKSKNNNLKFFEDNEESFEEFMKNVTLEDIFKAFENVMNRKEAKIDHVRNSFKSVERDLYTIDEKIDYIRDLIFLTPKITFKSIFRKSVAKTEIVVTFLALLELIKMKDIFVEQDKTFGEIIIKKYIGRGANET